MKMSLIKSASACILALALSAVSYALPIAGTLGIGLAPGANVTVDKTTNFVDFTAATSGLYNGFNGVVNIATGNFGSLISSGAMYTDFNYPASPGVAAINPLWIVGAMASFELTSFTNVDEAGAGLILGGLGWAYLTGFDKTPGLWTFSLDGNNTFNFSSTTEVPPPSVPDSGTTVALLGGALVAMGLISRRRV